MKKNANDKTIKLNFILIILSIILLIISFIINKSTVIRPIFWIIAISLLGLNIFYNNKLKITTIIIVILLFFGGSIILDGILSVTFKRIPVFAYNIITSGNTKVYNAIGIRIWQCDKNDYKNIIVDPFYKDGYMCDSENIDVLDSNSFLNSIVSNYSEYKNKYIKIKGKISKKTGQNYIEMQPYEVKSITVNGYVTFADNITLRILFKNNSKELDDFDIYDEITVLGIIKNLEMEDNKYIVYMNESEVISNINLKEFNISVTESNSCNTDKKLIFSNETNNVYNYCLEEMIVSYPDNNKYEIAHALSSNKLNISDLLIDPVDTINNEKENMIIYRFESYSALVCNNKDIILGKKDMSFDDMVCTNEEEIES